MSDSDLGGTPGWQERLAAYVDAGTPECLDCDGTGWAGGVEGGEGCARCLGTGALAEDDEPPHRPVEQVAARLQEAPLADVVYAVDGAIDAAYSGGRADETATVVAWLRAQVRHGHARRRTAKTVRLLADKIERGEHHGD